MNVDSMGHSFGPYETVFCDYCGGNHFSYNCPSNLESHHVMGDSNWDTSHFNEYTQSWEAHPNLSLNNQHHGTFTSPIPSYQDCSNTYSNTFEQSWEEQVDFSESFQNDEPIPSYQDWSNTYSNTFDQSWEERQDDFSGSFQGDDFNNSFLPPTPSFEEVDFSESFQGDDFNNSFLPPTSSFEQAEIFESLKALMNDFLQNLKESVDNVTTSVNEIINEQSQTPISCEIEKFECVGMDKGEAIILESNQETESFEEAPEHLSNPSSLHNNEEVQQDVVNVTNPCFESVQKEDTIAKSMQQSCAKNLKIIFKRGRENQSKDSKSFIKSSSTIGEVMWKTLCGVKFPLICAIKFLCRDQRAKEVNRKVYKHKWKEKHQVKLARTIRAEGRKLKAEIYALKVENANLKKVAAALAATSGAPQSTPTPPE